MVRDAPSDAPTFGALLRCHRRARGMTQETLAERAGVSVRAVSDLERGARSHPYRETAVLLADALELSGSERAALLASARRPLPPDGSPARVSPDSRLPAPLTRLIGRGEEQREIAGLLRDERVRLLTLTGPAGVGKTRLAVAVVAHLGDAFRDGVVFIDLAPVPEPALVIPAVAAALDLTDQGAILLVEAVRRQLASRQMLLVLDNFEHLLPAAPLLTDLLQAAPEVQALVTSRAVLRLHGEREYPVAPLRTPDPGVPGSPEELAEWEAIQLFVERAREAHSGFRFTPENASHVAAICRRVDGLPLALELVAARVRLLTPAALLGRLEQRFRLLTAGVRDAPPRQRTLQAAIAWSYDLLEPDQQTLLRSLAVFVGGWTMEGAEAVGGQVGVPDALDALAALVEQSLVVRGDGDLVPRFRMFESIREYAHQLLLAAGEENHVRRAHLDYLLQLARDNDLERLDSAVGTRLVRLQAEEANLRAGIEWALVHDPESALAVLAELDYFWFHADRQVAGRDLLVRVLMTGAGGNRRERARILHQAAWLAINFGDYVQAEPYADAARALAEQLGDAQTMAHAQMCQGGIAVSRDDVVRAKSLLTDALTQFETLGDLWGISVCLTELGIAELDWGDAAASATCFERLGAIVVAQDLPSRYHSHYLDNLAYAYNHLGRHEAAMEAGVAALRHARDAGGIYAMATSQLTVVRLLLDRGETAQAVSLCAEIAESLRILWEIGARWNLPQALELAAELIAAGHQAEPAARLLGAAAALRDAIPYPIGMGERARVARQLAEVSAALGERSFTQAWNTGNAQPLDAAVAEARASLGRETARLRSQAPSAGRE